MGSLVSFQPNWSGSEATRTLLFHYYSVSSPHVSLVYTNNGSHPFASSFAGNEGGHLIYRCISPHVTYVKCLFLKQELLKILMSYETGLVGRSTPGSQVCSLSQSA